MDTVYLVMIHDVQWINNGPCRLSMFKIDLYPSPKKKSPKTTLKYFEVIIFGTTDAKTIKVFISKQNVT